MKITKVIRQLRNEKGYSQEYMANKMGITQSAYCKLEREDNKIRLDSFLKISSILDTQAHEVLQKLSI